MHGPATPFEPGTALSHFVVQVESLAEFLASIGRHSVISDRRTYELEIHLVPVLLGSGRRCSRVVSSAELELVRRLDGRDATHLRFRIRRAQPRA